METHNNHNALTWEGMELSSNQSNLMNTFEITTENIEPFEGLYNQVMNWCKERGTVNVLLSIVVSTDFDFEKATMIVERLVNFLEMYKARRTFVNI